ncbi:MAG: GNAT family N-acetyltransferase [Ruminococcaceae bacterium]|nr:GNAT family N-acetyltransferase [Oscillospiraceae bacterium]
MINHNFKIKTERLELFPISLEYLESTFRYSSDKKNIKLMVFLPHDNINETKKYLSECEKQWQREDPDFLEFAVIFDGTHIGGMTLYFLDEGKTGELGWVIDKEYQNKGFVTEAANVLIKYAVEDFKVHRFIAQCDSENYASCRVAEKLGMKLIDDNGTRKNKGSDEIRKEFTFELSC